MRRFRLDGQDLIDNRHFKVSGSEFHHLKNVLRTQPGDRIRALWDNSEFVGKVLKLEDDYALCQIEQERKIENQQRFSCHLLCSVLKDKAMSILVHKATELGVSSIRPLICKHNVVKLNDWSKKSQRWQTIMQEASKQCGNPHLPQLFEPLTVAQLSIEPSSAFWFLSLNSKHSLAQQCESTLSKLSNDAKQAIYLAIGPEGDYTPEEEQTLIEKGALPLSCGSYTLKAETAAIYGACLIQSLNLRS